MNLIQLLKLMYANLYASITCSHICLMVGPENGYNSQHFWRTHKKRFRVKKKRIIKGEAKCEWNQEPQNLAVLITMNAREKSLKSRETVSVVSCLGKGYCPVLTYGRIGEDRQLAGIDPVSSVLPGMIHSAHRYRQITHQSIMFKQVSTSLH
jgi:hypothetical protein